MAGTGMYGVGVAWLVYPGVCRGAYTQGGYTLHIPGGVCSLSYTPRRGYSLSYAPRRGFRAFSPLPGGVLEPFLLFLEGF